MVKHEHVNFHILAKRLARLKQPQTTPSVVGGKVLWSKVKNQRLL